MSKTVDTTVTPIRAKAREIAFARLGRVVDQWRLGFAEERRKGTPEAKIKAVVDAAIAGLERDRGVVDDMVLDEMGLILREAAFSTHKAPIEKQ